MPSKSKNLIIIAVVVVILIAVYFFIIKKPTNDANLVPASGVTSTGVTGGEEIRQTADNFLAELLSIKSINLDGSIFSDPAFTTLRDSSINIVQDVVEGRPNPFAPIGSDAVLTTPPIISPPVITPTPVIPNSTN